MIKKKKNRTVLYCFRQHTAFNTVVAKTFFSSILKKLSALGLAKIFYKFLNKGAAKNLNNEGKTRQRTTDVRNKYSRYRREAQKRFVRALWSCTRNENAMKRGGLEKVADVMSNETFYKSHLFRNCRTVFIRLH